MKKILAFGATSSQNSINKQLATYAANQFANTEIEILDLNDFEMPIYATDKETQSGIPQLAHDFYNKLSTSDLIIISFAEHNGAYTSAFKNIFDWISRINGKTFQNKPMLLMATSPGPRGGSTVLDIAKNRFALQAGDIQGVFSLPSFNDNFSAMGEITNLELKDQLLETINLIKF